MCSPVVLEFVERVLTAQDVKGKNVLEVGAYDVNGSVRPYLESLEPRRYLGIDVEPGPGVDQVFDCQDLTRLTGQFEVVVSTEMLEHVKDWQTCLEQMVVKVKRRGLLLITTRSPGFGFHPFPEDHWRFTIEEMTHILIAVGLDVITVEDDTCLGCPGVFALARKPRNWYWTPSYHREVWNKMNIPEGRFDA